MLKFVNFKNGDTCVHLCILDVMLKVFSNRLMSKLTDTSGYLACKIVSVLKKIDKK